MRLFTGLLVAVALLLPLYAAAEDNKAAPEGDGWTALFDGKTLNGWMIKCREADKEKKYWKVVEGTITAEVPARSRHHYIWLMTEKEYGDFELRLKVQSQRGKSGNSGVQVRSRYDDKAYWLDGPQVDLHPPGPWRCGFIYDETREVKKWIAPIYGPPSKAKPTDAPADCRWQHADEGDGWNDVRIVCNGTTIKTFANDVPIVNYDGKGRLDDADHKKHNVGLKGHIALQIHPGGEHLIRFKDLRIKELK